MNPAAAPHPAELSTAQVRALLDTGGAVPLLPDHLPVPVRIETQWWHVPLTSAEPDASSHEASRHEASRHEASSHDESRHEARYVVAPPDQAAAYDRLAARLAAAAAATRPRTAVRAGAMSTSAMGSSPDPRSPDPRGPDATVADLASAAVLGAVLWDPRRLREVMDWLEPDDFLHPVHRAIYATVTGLVAAGEPVNLMRLPAALASGRFHEVHVDPSEPGPLGAAALHTLLAFTPATPPRGGRYDEQPRSEHVRYAQLVLEASVRRQVHAAGVRIAQHAREAIDVVDDSPTPPVYATVAAAVEKLGPVLDTIERHLQHLADRLDHPQGTGAGPPGATAAQRDADTTIGTGRVPAELPVPAELHHAELAVLGGCLVAPGVRRTALSILVPADSSFPSSRRRPAGAARAVPDAAASARAGRAAAYWPMHTPAGELRALTFAVEW